VAALLAFAFVSGIVTILSPCILPVLPVVLSGGVAGGKARPLGVVAGFVASFSTFTLALTAIVEAVGVSPDVLRIVAVALIAAFGLVMAVPALRGLFERAVVRIAGLASRQRGGGAPRSGFWAGLPVGVGLGLVWTPCVGPIMASVVSLALTQRVDGGAVAITLAYALGTSIPMLAVMVGGRALLERVPGLKRNAGRIQQGFGVLMIAVAVSIAFGLDRRLQAAILDVLPNYGAGLTRLEQAAPVREALAARDGATEPGSGSGDSPGKAEAFRGAPSDPADWPKAGRLADYGEAPEFVTGGRWLDADGGAAAARTLASLRGRVVVVDFWTYSCINCVRTIPYLRTWHEAYRELGLTIVGVHTPEFEFEKNPGNVERAMRDLEVAWPVLQDNAYAQWKAYGNRYWPAKYFIDARGRVRYFHFGEGSYGESERVIRALLEEAGTTVGEPVSGGEAKLASRTPETYLGSLRGTGPVGASARPGEPLDYRSARRPANGEWTLDGRWTIAGEYAVPETAGALELGFHARDVFLVVEPEGPGGSIEVLVDGRPAADTADARAGVLAPVESRMYHLVRLAAAGPHVLRLAVKGRLRLFAFTFG
jgi:cytochrome c biogenesis protein CcdA/thiol-disulfide isomerase/thioredoxin